MILFPKQKFSWNEIKLSSGQNDRYVIHCFRAYTPWGKYARARPCYCHLVRTMKN